MPPPYRAPVPKFALTLGTGCGMMGVSTVGIARKTYREHNTNVNGKNAPHCPLGCLSFSAVDNSVALFCF
jgi:hypothetical protein